jgi:glc operon protein GlcG
MTSVPTISLDDARRVLDAALAHATELGVAVSIVVTDTGGHVRASARMDGASFLSADLARTKAATAAGLGVNTHDFGQFVADIPLLLNGLSGQPGVSLLPGGVPVVVDGALAGAIGVAGGAGGEDHPVASAGLAALVPAGVAG